MSVEEGKKAPDFTAPTDGGKKLKLSKDEQLCLTQAIYHEALPRFAGLEQEMLAPLSLVEREMLSMLLAKVVLAMFNPHAEAGMDSDDQDGM